MVLGGRCKEYTVFTMVLGGRCKEYTLFTMVLGGEYKEYALFTMVLGGQCKEYTISTMVLEGFWGVQGGGKGRHSQRPNMVMECFCGTVAKKWEDIAKVA